MREKKVNTKAKSDAEGGIRLRVVPNARRSEVVGVHGDAIKVKVASVAVDGKANEALLEMVAGVVGVSVRAVRLISGLKSRDKIIGVEGVAVLEVRHRLLAVSTSGCDRI